MSDDHRIRIDVRDDYQATDERQVAVEADLGVQMEDKPTIWSRLGVIGIILGGLSIVLGCLIYIAGYPERWYALDGVTIAESKQYVKAIVLTLGVGLMLLLEGTALYFFGRHVNGKGRLRHLRLGETLEVRDG